MSTGSDAGISGSSTELGKVTARVSCSWGRGREIFGHMSTSSEVVRVICANVRSRELHLARFRRPVENVAAGTSEEEAPSSSSL